MGKQIRQLILGLAILSVTGLAIMSCEKGEPLVKNLSEITYKVLRLNNIGVPGSSPVQVYKNGALLRTELPLGVTNILIPVTDSNLSIEIKSLQGTNLLDTSFFSTSDTAALSFINSSQLGIVRFFVPPANSVPGKVKFQLISGIDTLSGKVDVIFFYDDANSSTAVPPADTIGRLVVGLAKGELSQEIELDLPPGTGTRRVINMRYVDNANSRSLGRSSSNRIVNTTTTSKYFISYITSSVTGTSGTSPIYSCISQTVFQNP